MANTFINTDLVAEEALAEFANNCPLVMTASRYYEDAFTSSGYKIGDTLRIRRQNRFTVGDGSTAVAQPILETVESLIIAHQYNSFIEYTVQDLSLRISDFNREFIQPSVQAIISTTELGMMQAAETTVSSFVGTPGTPINSFASVDAAGKKLLEKGVNLGRDAYMVLGLSDASSLKAGMVGNFTPTFNEEIVRYSQIGRISYFDVFQSQNTVRHIAGAGPRLTPGDTLTVNGAVSSGNTIVLAGATASVTNYFVPGDLISIAGVQTVNPLNYQSTGSNAQFVITAAANSTGGGAVTIQVALDGNGIIPTTALQNVTNAVPSGAAVTALGSHNINMAYISRGVDFAAPPLYKLQTAFSSVATDADSRLSMACVQQGNVPTYQNQMRLDLLNGYVWHPQYCVKVVS